MHEPRHPQPHPQEAEFLIRTRGYSAFSYADLAERVQITKASVHYYFPTKEELIVVLLREYIERFVATLARIKQQHAVAGDRLRAYADLFLDGFEKGMLPLCGALSAERSALPESMRPQVFDFFQIHLDWLGGVLDEGLAAGALRPNRPAGAGGAAPAQHARGRHLRRLGAGAEGPGPRRLRGGAPQHRNPGPAQLRRSRG